MIEVPRDKDGVAHIVGVSGGKDSTALWLGLNEFEPGRPYFPVCTPTGDELPEMFEHWRKLGDLFGTCIYPLMSGTLDGVVESNRMIPNQRARFCTRQLKIEPFKKWLVTQVPCVVYIGLRADEAEEVRAGADYGGDAVLSAPNGVTQRWPLREWGWDIHKVWSFLDERGVDIPERTDCARCFFQKLGEWFNLYLHYEDIYRDAERQEREMGYTWRSRKFKDGKPVTVTRTFTAAGGANVTLAYEASHRDIWPAWLKDLRWLFERGVVPERSLKMMESRSQMCRTCSL